MHGGNPFMAGLQGFSGKVDEAMTGATTDAVSALTSASKSALKKVTSTGDLFATKLDESKTASEAKMRELKEAAQKNAGTAFDSVVTNIRAKVYGSTPT